MDAIINLHISPANGGRLLTASAGLALLWLLVCVFLAYKDLISLEEHIALGVLRFPRRKILPYVRTNSISGLLGVASALTFTAANYPQPQTLSSFLVVILAICSALGWLDIEDPGELAPKAADVLTVAVTAMLVMDKANTYKDGWIWYHDPNLYCIVAFCLEAVCTFLGLWVWLIGPRGRQPGARRHAIAENRQVIPARLLLVCVVMTSLVSLALCVRALLGDIEPYLFGFGLVCATLLAATVLAGTILAQSYKRFTGFVQVDVALQPRVDGGSGASERSLVSLFVAGTSFRSKAGADSNLSFRID